MIVEWWENDKVTYIPIRILFIDGIIIPTNIVIPQTVEILVRETHRSLI